VSDGSSVVVYDGAGSVVVYDGTGSVVVSDGSSVVVYDGTGSVVVYDGSSVVVYDGTGSVVVYDGEVEQLASTVVVVPPSLESDGGEHAMANAAQQAARIAMFLITPSLGAWQAKRRRHHVTDPMVDGQGSRAGGLPTPGPTSATARRPWRR
jgi:hypothetical protein